jgi:transposase
MFFSAFTIDRAVDLVCLKGDPDADHRGVTGRVILECLKEQLPEIIEEGMTFQHDNGPTFKSHLVQGWLRKYAEREGVILIRCPPYSPDLNPIQNLWSILKERICKRYPDLVDLSKNKTAKDRLIEAAKELWHELEDEVSKTC